MRLRSMVRGAQWRRIVIGVAVVGVAAGLMSAMVASSAAPVASSQKPLAHDDQPVSVPDLEVSAVGTTDPAAIAGSAPTATPPSTQTAALPAQARVVVASPPTLPVTTAMPGFVGLPDDANINLDVCALVNANSLQSATGWPSSVVANRVQTSGNCVVTNSMIEATASWSVQAATSGPIATIFAGGWGPTQAIPGLGERAVVVDQDFLGMVAAVKGDRAIWVRLTGTSGAARTATLRAVAEAALVHL